MINNGIDKTSLKYLGEDYQYKLVKEFMEDKSCFKDLAPIIDQNMFTAQHLRTFVGTMLDYLKKHGDVPSYTSMSIEMRQKAHTQVDIELCEGVINKIRNTPSDGSEQTRELATKFFKQQNIIKAANEMLKLAGSGDLENYEKCEELLKNALNTGNHEDYEESRLFDGIEETLSNDSRTVIPTGIGKIDETLNGGIGKGELGVIVGPSGYGKVQPYDAKVLTPHGFVEMRDIIVGSDVIGCDGKPHKVTAVFPHNDWDFYKITFSDGASTECGKEHLWNIKEWGMSKELPFKTKSLEEVMNNPKSKYGLFYIQTNHPIENYEDKTIEERAQIIRDMYHSLGKNGMVRMPEDIADNFIELLRSLGHNGSITKIEDDIAYVSILLYQDGYKWADNEMNGVHRGKRYIKKIEFSRKYDGQCIMVDSDEHLYITDDFIVTHNTTVTTSMALTAAGALTEQNNYKGFKVMQIVFEDRIKQIQRKHFSKITQVEACNLSKDEYSAHVKEILSHYENRETIQENLRIIRLKSGEKSIDWIVELIKKHIDQGFRPDLVIIDYFECIKLTGPSQMAKWDKESAIMRKIEAAANELNIGFWVPVQGNRDSINAELVTMDNAGGSLGKIQIAHIIMSITRSLDDIAENIATISILKNRAGSSGVVIDGAMFNNGTCTISTDNVAEYSNGVEFNKHREESKANDKQNLMNEIFKASKR